MANLDPKKVLKSLKKKGFVVNNKADKHLELWHDGKFILHTYVSHGSKHEIGDFLIHQMSIQCKLDKGLFMDLVNCPLDKKKYIQILETKKVL